MVTPVILTIAGSDCSAGAGIQADIKVAQAHGVFAMSAVTCVVSEVPQCVRGIQEIDTALVADQVRICLDAFPISVVKTGMLYSPEIVRAVATELRDRDLAVVIDPVMIATAGDPLMLQSAIEVYEEELIPLACLLTPNLDELAKLASVDKITSEAQALEEAHALAEKYACAILAKGGHFEGECVDTLVYPSGEIQSWRHPKLMDVATHGTGCALSAAIASQLALGLPLGEAVEKSLEYIAKAILTHHRWVFPHQHDALNHFHS